MKQFWANHKIKLLAGIAILAVLAAAFYFGGSDPDSKGWSVSKTGGYDSPAAQETTIQKPVAPDASALQPVQQETEPSQPTMPLPETPVEPAAVEPDSFAEEPSVPQTPVSDQVQQAPSEQPEVQQPELPTPAVEAPDPSAEQTQPEPPEVLTCTVSIRCTTILDHLDEVIEGTKEIIPADGWILYPVEVTFSEGETVFDVLQRILQERKIHLEFSISPLYGSAYIEGIANLYEFDCGSLSGWLYCVNGWFPNYGSSSYVLSDADRIEWQYTCDLGYDIGGGGIKQ